MKKSYIPHAITTTIKALILTVSLILLFLDCSWYTSHYTKKGTVIQSTGNTIAITDTTGHTWLAKNDNHYQINDNVKLTIYTNDTDLNTDDDIIEKLAKEYYKREG